MEEEGSTILDGSKAKHDELLGDCEGLTETTLLLTEKPLAERANNNKGGIRQRILIVIFIYEHIKYGLKQKDARCVGVKVMCVLFYVECT